MLETLLGLRRQRADRAHPGPCRLGHALEARLQISIDHAIVLAGEVLAAIARHLCGGSLHLALPGSHRGKARHQRALLGDRRISRAQRISDGHDSDGCDDEARRNVGADEACTAQPALMSPSLHQGAPFPGG
jgi:hypothetical protein